MRWSRIARSGAGTSKGGTDEESSCPHVRRRGHGGGADSRCHQRGAQPAGGGAILSPINVGDIASLTGPEASSIDQTTEVLEAWAKTVNAKGGLQGHPVNVIVKDDGYNPATSLADVESFVTGDHIVALIDNSDVDTSWYSYVEQNKVPVIGGQTEDGPYENADFFDPARRSTTSLWRGLHGQAGALQGHGRPLLR